jgi:hypothetical protein
MRGDESHAVRRQNHFRCSFHKKHTQIVLLHVCNRIGLRWVPGLWARGKNATEFTSRANQCMSCCEQRSLMWLKPAEWCGTIHQRQDTRPRRGSRRESSLSGFPILHLLVLQIDCRVKKQACQVLFSSFMGEVFPFSPVKSPVVEGRKSQYILHPLSIRRNLFYIIASRGL